MYRMLRGRTFALVLAVAALALPATALAQSAGDDQYQDPLAGQNGGGNGSNGNSGSNSGSTPSTPAPATGTTPASTSTPQGATASSKSRGQLPRTGFDVILTIELGLAMLLTGLVTHRMLMVRELTTHGPSRRRRAPRRSAAASAPPVPPRAAAGARPPR